MKLVGLLTSLALIAAPVWAGAHGGGMGGGAHAGMGRAAGAHVGPGSGGGAWRGQRFAGNHGAHDHFRNHVHDRFHDNHFHDHGFAWGWAYPYWGWECGPDDDACDWSDEADGRGYAGDPPAADPPRAAVASNECSDWVWRADLHRSVCRRSSRG